MELIHNKKHPNDQHTSTSQPSCDKKDPEQQVSLYHKKLAEKALALMQTKKYEQSILILKQILQKNPKNAFALETTAECAMNLQEFSTAIECYQNLVILSNQISHKIQLAKALHTAHQNDLALDIYLEIQHEAIPSQNLYLIHKNIGDLYLRRKNLKKAREHYDKSFELAASRFHELSLHYGALELHCKQFNKALLWLREAIENDANNDKAWLGLAIMHNEYGDLDIAWANLEQALDLNPINETALQLYFQWGLRNHKLEAVVQRYERAISQHPRPGTLKVNFAQALASQGQLQRAFEQLQSISLSHSHHKESQFLRELLQKSSHFRFKLNS